MEAARQLRETIRYLDLALHRSTREDMSLLRAHEFGARARLRFAMGCHSIFAPEFLAQVFLAGIREDRHDYRALAAR